MLYGWVCQAWEEYNPNEMVVRVARWGAGVTIRDPNAVSASDGGFVEGPANCFAILKVNGDQVWTGVCA